VIRIESEQRVDVLRQVALLQEREIRTLYQRIEHLTTELVRLQGGDASALQLELEQLRELLARRERALFAESSEKRPQPPSEEAPVEKPAPRGHGPQAQPRLPEIERLHELPESQRECPQCGGQLVPLGDQSEDCEEITVVERHFVLVKQRCRKYRCRCNASVVTAPGPRKLIPGGRYSPEFAVEVAISKYADHLPLERQAGIMEREGLEIGSQTLWDQIDALAGHLKPTYEALCTRVLASPRIGADETYWRLMGGEESSRWWVWCLTSDEAVVYRLCSSRSAKAARALLGGYRGIVIADGYGVYESLARDGPSFTLAHCWAHVRRKFVEIEPNYPAACSQILDRIGELYAIERLAPTSKPETAPLRAQLRHERSRPIVEDIRRWALSQGALPRGGLGRAIGYMLGLWSGLTRFLDDPRIPLDTNAVERALRGVVVGRKNHYGSRSRRGTEVAALFYTLCESAKLTGVEPRRYLLAATHAAIDTPGTATLPQSLLD
jgi:transposase